jgi:tRNA pseudouridine38-40 synthase
MKYFFSISYNGTAYHGWQKQKNAVSVQGVLEDRLSVILRKNLEIIGSGRTDTGVHAREQVFHVEIPGTIIPEQIRIRLNAFLPSDISVQAIYPVINEAHARFDATERSYEYLLIHEKDPFLHDFTYRFSENLSLAEMNKACHLLLGKQDFQCFSRVKTDVNNFICTVTKAEWGKDGNALKFQISANRFLRGMVRAIVGTLLDIGQDRRKTEDIPLIIESRDRRMAGRAVPAKGLYLTKVSYPSTIFI